MRNEDYKKAPANDEQPQDSWEARFDELFGKKEIKSPNKHEDIWFAGILYGTLENVKAFIKAELERQDCKEKLAHLENFYKKFAEQRYREGIAEVKKMALGMTNNKKVWLMNGVEALQDLIKKLDDYDN